MNAWKIILATIVIFAAGVFTGGLLVNHISHPHWKSFHRPEPSATNLVSNSISNSVPSGTNQPMRRLPEILNKQFLQRLDEELHLTQEQHEAIQKIISDGQNLMRKTIQDARLEIREQLTLDQRAQFDELVKRPPPRRPSNGTNAPSATLTNAVSPGATNAPR